MHVLRLKNGGRVTVSGVRAKPVDIFANTGIQTLRVRRAQNGVWYAVRSDGTVLGRNGQVYWFATALEAGRAVSAERHTPVDSDPFATPRKVWRWLKHVARGLDLRRQEMQEMYSCLF
jgi:hypothetical protein